MGALVADAASLGCHWIYDVARLADIAEANDGRTAFTPIDAENYAEVQAYFAHGQRSDGMLTQYGETLRLTNRSMIEHGGKFECEDYQKDYAEVFGPGGTYRGYIDAATAGTLKNISNDVLDPSGIDDHQHPAITRLPAIALAYGGDEDFNDQVETAIRVTNLHKEALSYGLLFAQMLNRVLEGAEINEAMDLAAEDATGDAKRLLHDALSATEQNSIAYGETTGRACYLNMGMPLMFHILKQTNSFEEAIEANNLAGGDNAGRAIMIGALMGARHGIAGEAGIPLSWILRTHDADEIWHECLTLAEIT